MSQFDQTPVRLDDRRFLESHDITLETGNTKAVDVYGRYFLVRAAREEFEMRIHNGQWFTIAQGEGFDVGEEDRFNKLSFRLPVGVEGPLQVLFRTSDCYMFDARLSIVRDPNFLQIVTQYPAPTYAVRPMPLTLAALASAPANVLALPGILVRNVWPCAPAADWLYMLPEGVNRAQRKSLRIESDVALSLLWWNGVAANLAAGPKVASVPMNTSVPFYEETSQDFALKNGGAAVANIALLALFDVPVWFSLTSEDP
jgi:hypothetical protein